MEFLHWLYDRHWFLGAVFSPHVAIFWGIYTHRLWYSFGCFLWTMSPVYVSLINLWRSL